MNTRLCDLSLRRLWSRRLCRTAWLLLWLPLLAATTALGQAWTPANLPAGELKNWYDAADTNTLWQDAAGTIAVSTNGQKVLLWQDKSGNGNHLTSTNGPAYTNSAMHALPVLTFADNGFTNNAPNMGAMTDNYTVVSVFKVTSNNNYDQWLRWGNGNQGGGDLAVMVDGTARAGGVVGSMEFHYDGTTGSCTTNAVLNQPAFIFAGGFNQVASPTNLFTIWENGAYHETMAAAPQTVTLSSSLTLLQIGYSPVARNPNGYMAEVLILNTGTTNLNEADRQKLEGYLAHKWWGAGTNNPLPALHPYKNVAPGAPSYSIMATNGVGGSISPGGSVPEVAGQNQTFTITPDNAYGILNLVVDGVSQGALSSYTFTNVQANHTIGASFFSLTVPPTPTNLMAVQGEETVALSWSASQYALSYNVQRATVPGGPYTTIATTLSPSYTDGMVVAGTTYYYVVSATNYVGESAISGEASATPQLNPNLWKPLALGSSILKNWYDAADYSTVFQDYSGTTPVTANGQMVLVWNDKSGNGNNLGSVNGPAYSSGAMNSLPVMTFADSSFYNNQALNMGNITDNFTVFGVFKATGNNSWDNWVRWGNGDQGGGDLSVYIDTAARPGGAVGSMEFHYDGGTGSYTTNTILGQSAFLFGGEVNQVNNPTNLFTTWENGVSQGTRAPTLTNTPSSSLAQLQIGYADTSTRNPNGQIAELLILNTGTNTLSEADRQKIEGYLATKWWGTGANNPLPALHPYKNVAPGTPSYSITATSGVGGSISPSGTIPEVAGQNQTLAITPNSGAYIITNVVVDGVSLGAVSSYTFTNVQANHTIAVTFFALPVPPTPTSLVATTGEEAVVLTWGTSQYAAGYEVQRATVSGGPYTTIATTASTSYTDGMVICGTNYYYVVSATNYVGESAISAEASAGPQLNAALWKPSALGSSTVKNWYDAADFGTVFQDVGATTPVSASGQAVLAWSDKSGNGNHLTSTNGPAYTTGSGLPVLTFADNSFSNGAPVMGSMTDNFTVIGVFKVTGNNNFDHWVKWGNGDQGGADLYMMVDGSARANGSAGSMEFHYDGATGSCTTNAVLGQPTFIFAAEVNQTANPANLFTVWENGAFQGTMAPSPQMSPSSSLTYFQIGYAPASNRNPNGQIAEVLILNTGTNTLAEADRQKIEGYLANKWWGAGANNPLAVNHPYKNSPPSVSVAPPPVPVLLPGAVTVASGMPSVTFATVSGYQYRVVYKNSLSDATWLVVAPGFVTSTGANMTVTDTTAAGQSSRFYRVEAANP